MNYFKVYDKQEKCYLEPIYKAYEGKIFDFYLNYNGGLTFRCQGMKDKGYPNGYTDESIITKSKDRFEIVINKQDNIDERIKPIPPAARVVYDEGELFIKFKKWLKGDKE